MYLPQMSIEIDDRALLPALTAAVRTALTERFTSASAVLQRVSPSVIEVSATAGANTLTFEVPRERALDEPLLPGEKSAQRAERSYTAEVRRRLADLREK